MGKIESYKCDCCGKIKGESNHWFVFFLKKNNDRLVTEIPDYRAIITVSPFSHQISEPEGSLYLCGAECVAKVVQSNLESL